jgi:hypothetical protein
MDSPSAFEALVITRSTTNINGANGSSVLGPRTSTGLARRTPTHLGSLDASPIAERSPWGCDAPILPQRFGCQPSADAPAPYDVATG